MTFFNSKEEVMSIVLTGYGKHKLSVGEFKPEFYAFFDDGIIYDITHTSGQEAQNDIEPRILDNTPYLKPQPYYHGVETEYTKFHDSVKEESVFKQRPFVKPPMVTREKDLLQLQIGSIDIDSIVGPEILFQSLQGNKLTTRTSYSSSFNNNTIPQIDINPYHIMKVLSVSEKSDLRDNLSFDMFSADDQIIIDGFSLGQAITVEEGEIFLQLSEDSINTNENNFMVEFFEIDETSGTEVLIPLKTKPVGEANKVTPTQNFVETYFDVQTDYQVPKNVLCKKLNDLYLNDKSVLLKKKVDCSEFKNHDTRFNIYGDIKKEPENC